MTMATMPGSEKLDLRLTPEVMRTLYAAVTAARRSVSEFVLESALTRAEGTLADRRLFGLNAGRWVAFFWRRWMRRRAPCHAWSG
jgi:uncharacterized protein (DUF1778 family)